MVSGEALETEGKMISIENAYYYDNHNGSPKHHQEKNENDKSLEANEEKCNSHSKNRMHAKVDSENVSNSNEYFQKVKTVEVLVSFWGLLQIGNSIIIYEVLNSNNDGEKDNFLKQSLAISTITSIGLTISIFFKAYNSSKMEEE